MESRTSSHFLFATPSFWGGWARIWDLGDTLTEYNRSVSPTQADFLALKSDWYVVGDAIVDAYEEARSGTEQAATA